MKEILGSALEVPVPQRPALLDLACGGDRDLRDEVEALLRYSDDVDEFIETPAIADGIALIDQSDADAMIGRSLGPFRIVEFLGEGGSSTVYRAVRDQGDFEQQIAIKILKRGMDSTAALRRFRDERRILARLDHPNIARLLDAGIADDGRPYFAMEYLEGTPIHRYCRDHELGLRDLIEMFVCVCSAVEYSHRNLVIHRDLKASNILMTASGVPKLLDFGIAKLLDSTATGADADATQAAERMMTPDYASPEQIAGETITTSSDVYSLGVLLYELLAGKRPFHLAGLPLSEMLRIVNTTEPQKPGQAASSPERSEALRGDLDTIVAKAMHRRPERRYASPEHLAEDLRRYLSGRTVLARPDSSLYRIGKFVSRNRASVLAVGISMVALVFAAFTTVWQTAVSSSREQELGRRSSELRELTSGLLGDLDAALGNLPGATGAREILARRVLKYLDGVARQNFADAGLQGDLASAYERLGDILGSAKLSHLGDYAGALECYRKELSILEKLTHEAPGNFAAVRQRARAHSRVSDVLAVMGDHAAALAEEQKALGIRTAWLKGSPDDPEAKRAVASSVQEIAGDLDRMGRFAESLENRRRVLAIYQQFTAADQSNPSYPMYLATSYKRVGKSLALLKKYDEAADNLRHAIEVERAELRKDPVGLTARFGLSFSLTDLGFVLRSSGHIRESLEALTEAKAIREELSAADPKDWRAASLLAATLHQMGLTLESAGRRPAAGEQIRRALRIRQDLSARSPNNSGARGEVAESEIALADLLQADGKVGEAAALYRRALTIFSEMESKGSLTAELAGEPQRVRAKLQGLQNVSVSQLGPE